eukprot:TRINITY_DN23307_c0_g1_i2.p2 TRINITY_DN23307_c0_g1~~TRINITY_DN23307_c0_g1_i2.p2  ORF type:complete len:119 (-),score=0.93 TRINITY_DN23307_c0_g1_i2:190-546(-)
MRQKTKIQARGEGHGQVHCQSVRQHMIEVVLAKSMLVKNENGQDRVERGAMHAIPKARVRWTRRSTTCSCTFTFWRSTSFCCHDFGNHARTLSSHATLHPTFPNASNAEANARTTTSK